MRLEPSSYHYAVERPDKSFLFLKNSKLYVCGWFFDSQGRPGKLIKVLSNKNEFICKPQNRMDIQLKYEEMGISVDPMCGFYCHCELSRGVKHVRILALLHSGQWIKLASNLIIVHKTNSKAYNKEEPLLTTSKPVDSHSLVGSQNGQWLKVSLELFLANGAARLKFPFFPDPLISIVMSTRNRAELLYQCLQSILAHVSIPYELIIADNCSTDATAQLLAKVEGIKTFKNEQDLEYLLSVNKAASMAKGKYLLLLNNDIILSPQSIDHLLRTIESYPGCGAVGCKLVRPDGSLQEAGSIIWADGSGLAYGRNDPNPMSPEYSFVREVDYCSAACLLVRRELWERLGGYDPRYVPAYYEDSDLCLGLWSLGYKVVYQPAALVFHYEFGSRSIKTALKMMEKNSKKFLEKWQDRLKTLHRPDFDVLKGRDRRNQSLSSDFKGRLLFIDDRVPHPRLGSGFGRSWSILRVLERSGYLLTFYPLVSQEYPLTNGQSSFLEKIELMLQWGIEKLENFLEERQGYYDLVFVSRPHNFRAFSALIKRRPELVGHSRVIYDAEAIYSLREILKKSLYGIDQTEEEKTRLIQEEISLGRLAHRVVAVTSREARYFEGAGCRVFILGHALECHPTQREFKEREGFLFVGYMGEENPNTDGLYWFAYQVLPILKKKIQDNFEVFAVGKALEDFVKKLEPLGIKFLGELEDLQPLYERSRVFIVPTRYAAGIPMKAHEAASYGIPMVATSLIAEQLSWVAGEHLLIADDPEEFAECCLKLYKEESLWKKIRQRALDRVKEDCDPKKFEDNLLSILKFSERSEERKMND
ncbi:glycosyltransferase [Candidatus Methylacidiphilum infernorum]|uniref:Glycosyltransferase n=1 Tax=Candidatus Methylacidiphilum infernorum TaxID=511746 RepID=A0ABX7PUN8_9BACT|nr:glycosyltransferase [Candidatus Methylacidiphilum infernorum]QSR86373.1 glycosyltransferase [Candidatus Methylacidiphilum infernorum]